MKGPSTGVGVKPIGPNAPNWAQRWNYILTDAEKLGPISLSEVASRAEPALGGAGPTGLC